MQSNKCQVYKQQVMFSKEKKYIYKDKWSHKVVFYMTIYEKKNVVGR